MGLHYRVEGRVLRFDFVGGTPIRDIYVKFHRAYQHHALPDDALMLVDLRNSTSLASRTPEIMKMISEFVIEHPERPGDRLAVILPSSQMERWQPLFEEMNGRDGVMLRVFDDEQAALGWLDGGSMKGAANAHGQ